MGFLANHTAQYPTLKTETSSKRCILSYCTGRSQIARLLESGLIEAQSLSIALLWGPRPPGLCLQLLMVRDMS